MVNLHLQVTSEVAKTTNSRDVIGIVGEKGPKHSTNPFGMGAGDDGHPNLCLDIWEDRIVLAFRRGAREQIGNFQRLPDHGEE
jgi:hypothetical protein